MRFRVLCLVLIFAACTSTNNAVQPTLRGPIVPTRVIPTHTPTMTPTETSIPTDTNTPTTTPTDTPVPTDTNTPTNTPEPPTSTPQPTDTLVPTSTDTPEPTATNSLIPPTDTPAPTDTPEPTNTPELTDTPEPTIAPTPSEAVVYTGSTSLDEVLIYDTLTLDNVISGTIDDEHPAALYAFNSTAGMVVHIAMLASGGDLDPFLLVLDPKGREIARNDDIDSESKDATIVPLTLAEAGTYIIVATRYYQDYGASTGTFDIGISLTDPQTDQIGTFSQPISYNSLITGTLDDTTSGHVYTFRATEGDVITIQMTRTSGDLDSRLSLTNNLGSEIAGNDDSVLASNFDAAIQSFIIPRSGYYSIVAGRYTGGSNSGDYRLKLALESQGAAGRYAALDPNNSTTINDGGDYYPNFSAGDEVDNNNQERAIQTLLTFRLPPDDGRTLDSATFSMQPCYETGGGFNA
ncbi:MAG: hypothetical protein U0521_28955, partial [Anaerolineae bacterium]